MREIQGLESVTKEQKFTFFKKAHFEFLIRGQKKRVLGLFFVSVIFALSESSIVASVYPLIGSLVQTPSESFLSIDALNKLGLHTFLDRAQGSIIVICGFIVFAQLLKFIFGVLQEAINARITADIMSNTKNLVFEKLSDLEYSELISSKSGELSYVGTVAPSKAAIAVSNYLQLGVESLKAAFILATILVIDFKVTLAMGALGFCFAVLNQYVTKKVSYITGAERRIHSGNSLVYFQEFLNGIKQISVFGVQKFWGSLFNSSNEKFGNYYVKDQKWLAISNRAFECVSISVCCIALGVLAYFEPALIQQKLPLVSVFLFAIIRFVPSVASMGRLKMQIAGARSDVERLYDFCTKDVASIKDGTKDNVKFERGIRFENLKFQYENGTTVFSKLNLEIKKNQTIAFVGPSGAGKTTIVNMLVKLIRPSSGRILIDDVDLSSIKMNSWRKHIGLVSQDSFSSHGTILENIVFGRSEYSVAEIEAAARMANAHEFIEQLPEKYQTIVGERGLKLSGGQGQRIAIARALLANPPIIIFDEATSALDNHSESLIHQTIKNLSGKKTIIIIAHRLATIEHADVIHVIRDQEIVESGNFSDLLVKKGDFFSLYSKQGL